MANLIKIGLLIAAAVLLSTATFRHLNGNSISRKMGSDLTTFEQFEQWRLTHGKHYTTPEERNYRLQLFKEKIAKILHHNSLKLSWTIGLNAFSDMTTEEVLSKHTGLSQERPKWIEEEYNMMMAEYPHELEVSDLPNPSPSGNVDWSTAGGVNPVALQGNCGSDYAFSAAGAIAGIFFSHYKPDTVPCYSVQQILDCSWGQGNEGCKGGLMQFALKWAAVGGIASCTQYPYTAQNQKCQPATPVWKPGGYKAVPHRSVSALAKHNEIQPISVSIEATHIIDYKSGVYADPACGVNLNHGVLLVGFSHAYWKIQNTWGTSWGEDGYMRMSTTASPEVSGGICGILLDASYPVIA